MKYSVSKVIRGFHTVLNSCSGQSLLEAVALMEDAEKTLFSFFLAERVLLIAMEYPFLISGADFIVFLYNVQTFRGIEKARKFGIIY